MTALLKLRDYQRQTLDAFRTRWDAGIWRPAGVLPTGAGKTVVFSHMSEEHLAQAAFRHTRVLVLAHTDELVNQAADKMRKVAPHRTVGIVKATQNEVHAQVIVASVQSLRSAKRRALIRNVSLIIVDECHHATAKTYMDILRHFGALAPEGQEKDFTPTCRVAGFTATLVRGDKMKLSDVWQEVAYRKSIAFMIRSGYLLDVRGKRVEVPDFELSKVKTSGGDYQEGALGEALIESLAPEVVAKAYLEHADGRKGIIFAPTVESAYAFADAFNDQGIKTEVVHGALARDERRGILERFRNGTTQCVANCMVLTEGFDEPTADVAVIARATKSGGLYQQMVGRVLRPDLTIPAAQREKALIMDVVGVSRTHGLQSLVDLSEREELKDREDLDLDDLSLLELDELELEGLFVGEEEGQVTLEGDAYYAGPVEVDDFDPLARDSSRVWGRTPAGHYWMTAGGEGYVFLVDSLTGDPGTFDVIWCTKELSTTATQPQAGMTEHKGLSFEMALSWAEEEALERGGHGAKTLTAKKSAWRKEPATSGQVWKASKYGITVPRNELGDATWTKGQVSEAIDNAQAALRIDPLVRAVMSTRRR
jgi:superfamily II DNA or RNA helicase